MVSYNNSIGTPEWLTTELEPDLGFGVGEAVLEFVNFPEVTGVELCVEEEVPVFR